MDLKFAQVTNHLQFDAAARIEVEDTDFGFHYAALRSIRDSDGYRTEAMITAFVAPCFVALPHNDVWLAFVPINDHLTVFYHVWWNPEKRIGEDPYRSKHLKFIGLDKESLDSYGLDLGHVRRIEQDEPRANYFKKDLAAARRGHFTGLLSFHTGRRCCVDFLRTASRSFAREIVDCRRGHHPNVPLPTHLRQAGDARQRTSRA